MDTTYTALIVLSSLSALVVILAWQFDRHIYIPFLRRMNIEPARQTEFNPHLLPLGLAVLGCSAVIYAVIGCVWSVIKG